MTVSRCACAVSTASRVKLRYHASVLTAQNRSSSATMIARIRAVKLCSTFMIQIRLSSRFLYHIQNTKKFKVAAFEKQIKKVQFFRCRSLL